MSDRKGLGMQEVRDQKDLTIYDVQSESDEETTYAIS